MDRCQKVCAKLNQKRKENHFCDATLVVSDKEFPVHKVVLSSASPYFSAMFEGGFSEKSSEKIEIKSVPSETLSTVLDYMYGADIELTLLNVTDIYRAADMLCVDFLIADCKSYITKKMEKWDCVEQVYEVASALDMRDTCEDIVQRARQMLSSAEFRMPPSELSYSFLHKVLEGRSDVLHPEGESCIVNNILHWGFLGHKTRIPDQVLKVISAVHFEYVTQKAFNKILYWFSKRKEKHAYNENCLRLEEGLQTAYRLSHRKALDLGFQLVLHNPSSNTEPIVIFTSETWTWNGHKLGLDQRPPISLVLSDNNIYIFNRTGSGHKFDLNNNVAVKLSATFNQLIAPGIVFSVVDKTVYVMGPFANKRSKREFNFRILKLEPRTRGHWEECINNTKAITCSSSVTRGHEIFLLGKELRGVPTLFVYNTMTSVIEEVFTFEDVPEIPRLAIHEDVLYIFSGVHREVTELCFVAFDLKHMKVLTGNVNVPLLDYAVLTAHPVAEGILIAHFVDKAILLTLYRPRGDCATQVLGVVSLPEEMPYFDVHNVQTEMPHFDVDSSDEEMSHAEMFHTTFRFLPVSLTTNLLFYIPK